MPNHHSTPSSNGFFAALAAFVAWGLLPIYWKSLAVVNPFEILCHRIVWSLAFITVVVTILKGWNTTFASMRSLKDIGILALSSLTIGGNWFLYIWAVNTGHVLETSLGYYINPLVTMLLGFVFFRERMKPLQVIAIGLAALGVANSIFSYGHFPWISLTLAISFAFYGLLRKIASVESLPGLFLETLILTPIALGYLVTMQLDNSASFLAVSPKIDLLLIGAGAATAIPLIGFAYGARRLRLTTLGILQYSAPSLTFLLGIFVYKEHFTSSHLLTFALIWAGLIVYTGESIWTMRNHRHTS
ncbi:EamA family transporter RarD [Pseudodesulfovibrio sp. JC047]|uniref:EamA family transporter RarD n=1 Tax=Pseudodesulfovibrio sp. JC047 TaxID=2683199 RepID=UPI0013D7693E|nr:EamA family transporter RarD [Pseudodesulfovibrio sp. JC047]NDV19575.1 EamA family transporter RarD [Pseudodesulfovibrio sp. JC047]